MQSDMELERYDEFLALQLPFEISHAYLELLTARAGLRPLDNVEYRPHCFIV